MTGQPTPEEIVTCIRTGLAPYHVEARVHDYYAKISLKTWLVQDGPHLFNLDHLPMHELRSPGYLADLIDGTRRELEAKAKRLS